VDREEFRSDAAQRLTPAEFADASDLLWEIAKSQNPTIRRNLIVAWAELIRRSDDPDLQKKAANGLIEVVLGSSDETAGASLTECAAQELADLNDEKLIDDVMSMLRETMSLRTSPGRFSAATKLANALIRRRLARGGEALNLAVAGYVSQWRLSLSQWASSLRDSLPVLLVAAAVAAVVPLSLANLGSRYGVPVDIGNAIMLFGIPMIVVALVSQAAAVPASALVRASRPLEALNLALMCILALLFMKLALSLDLTQLTFQEPDAENLGMPIAELDRTRPRQPTTPGIWPYLGWIAFGVFASRWMATNLASLARSALLASAAAAAIAVLLAVAGAVLSGTAGADGGWIAIVLVIIAAATGSTWADHRRGGRLVPAESGRLHHWPVAGLLLLAALVVIGAIARHSHSSLQNAQEARQSQITKLQCRTDELVRARVRLGQIFSFRDCGGRALLLRALEPPVPRGGPGSRGRIDTVLVTFDEQFTPQDRGDDPPEILVQRTGRGDPAFACIEAFSGGPACGPPTRSSATLGDLLSALASIWRGESPERFFTPGAERDRLGLGEADRRALENLGVCAVGSDVSDPRALSRRCGPPADEVAPAASRGRP
jgi:hypothetical protein